MDWDKNGMVTFKEFLFAFTRWVGIDDVEDEEWSLHVHVDRLPTRRPCSTAMEQIPKRLCVYIYVFPFFFCNKDNCFRTMWVIESPPISAKYILVKLQNFNCTISIWQAKLLLKANSM